MGTTGKQAKSWCGIYGTRSGKQGLLAQVFFPTNVAGLDPQDESVLDHLIEHYKYALLGRKLEFQFVGFADYRGNAAYNKKLSGRRAKAVQAYVDERLRPYSTYFSSSTVAMGESGAGRKHIELDRRVEIVSSFVLPRPPIDLGETIITGKVPPKMVKRPVQFLDIERTEADMWSPHDAGGKTFHMIIVEKWAMIEETRSVAFNGRKTDTALHSSFPQVKRVYRYKIDWRKPEPSDTGKKVTSTVLDLIAGVLGAPGGYDFSEGIPSLQPPNSLYKDWDAFAKKNPSGAEEYSKYWMKSF